MPHRKIVIVAGSGRSGTTWLGSILDTYERCDYFYEIDAFPDLDFGHPSLRRSKYPLTHWLDPIPVPLQHLEHQLLLRLQHAGIAAGTVARALRIRNRFRPKRGPKEADVFKIVRLFSFALRCHELASTYGDDLKIVHIIRNPFAQLTSQHRMLAAKNRVPERPFKAAFARILEEPRLEGYRDLARRYAEGSWFERSAVVWRAANELLLDSATPSRTTVLFEDLVRRPREETERIFRFLGWPPSQRTYDHIAETTDPQRADDATHSIRKSADAVLHRWRERMAATDYEEVRRVLAGSPLLRLWSEEELRLAHPAGGLPASR